MRYLLLMSYLLGPFFAYSQTTSAYSSDDTSSLTSVAIKWQKYWNIRDMDSMGTLLLEDVDFINVAGVWLKR